MRPFALAAACLLLAACQSAPAKAPRPVAIAAKHYDRAVRAAAGTLRDFGFSVDRSDARMGVVSSLPKSIPTSGEWWDGSAPNGGAWEARANLQDLRHRVRLTLAPTELTDDGMPKPGTDYRMSAQAVVERLDSPTRRVTAGWDAPVANLSEVPEHWRTRGVEDAQWQPIGHDADLEQALLDDIEKRMQ